MFQRLFNRGQRQYPSRVGASPNQHPWQQAQPPQGINPQFGAMRQANIQPPHMPMQGQRQGFMPMPPSLPPHPPQPNQPYHDPAVRFEPLPSQMPPNMPAAANAPEGLKIFLQGEHNSLLFYEKLASAGNTSQRQKEQLAVILEGKRNGLSSFQSLNVQAAEQPEVQDFRTGLSFALEQEAGLLREAAALYASAKDAGQQQLINSIIYSKIADIAQLLTL